MSNSEVQKDRLSQGQMYPGPNSPAKLMFRRSKKKVPFCTQLLKWICKKRKRRVSKTNEHFCSLSRKRKKSPLKNVTSFSNKTGVKFRVKL